MPAQGTYITIVVSLWLTKRTYRAFFQGADVVGGDAVLGAVTVAYIHDQVGQCAGNNLRG